MCGVQVKHYCLGSKFKHQMPILREKKGNHFTVYMYTKTSVYIL